MAIIPNHQISTLGPYSLRVTTSGAIQYGVPTIVVRFECAGSEICAQNPKSATKIKKNISTRNNTKRKRKRQKKGRKAAKKNQERERKEKMRETEEKETKKEKKENNPQKFFGIY